MAGDEREESLINPETKTLTLPETTDVEGNPRDIQALTTIGTRLWEKFDTEVEVDFPSKKNDGNWVLRNQGYAGRIELDNNWSVILEPKVTIGNLFRMLEYAYDLESFEFLEGLYDSASVEDFFDRLANLLAKRVLSRQKQGYYKQYIDRSEESETIRGRIDFRETARHPWNTNHQIEYSELTANNEENQILLWTLFKALSVGVSETEAHQNTKRAYRTLNGQVSFKQFRASDCEGRNYNRLNQDYETMHMLCRLILDNTGPTHATGKRKMVPFRVEMPTLYETFVARWLDQYVLEPVSVASQERYYLGDTGQWFDIDMVLYDDSGDDEECLCVADTKYKDAIKPKTSDIEQVVAYAEAKGTSDAFLIYPSIENPIDIEIGDVRVRTLTFELEDDLEENGDVFGYELLSAIGRGR